MTLSNAPRIDAQEILAGIKEWVEVESPSTDGAAVNRLVDKVAVQLAQIGARVERVPGRDGFGDHIRARSPWGGDGPGIVVLGHLDTVWPNGTLRRRPVTVEGDKVFGPGIYDMKSGDHIAFYAYRHLVRQGRETKLPVTFLFVSEEEVGSPTSRALIEETARNAKYVLVMEPGRPGGAVVTSRKAVGRFDLRVRGVSAHAGAAHENGRSAVAELARQILALEAMTDYARGITVNVGVASGGTPGFANVVPDQAAAEIDFRAPDLASSDEMVRRISGLAPLGKDVSVEVSGGINRPPFEKHEGVTRLYEHAKRCAEELGQELPEVSTGGGSDGNFTAALGVPTLDGLGAVGAGAHAEHEHILVSSLEPRVRLMVKLFETLE
ncbi:MAG: M20/M25/M40 family metallo-hydrolase [Rhodospirillales bacterium]|nr:M20/M25/M40 family metallo-hydrolase [Rhodospirillales bacterium]